MKPRGTLWELLMSTTASLNDRNLNRANGLRLFRWHPSFGWCLGAVCLAYFADGRSSVPLAAWLFPAFMLRFVRLQRPLTGLAITYGTLVVTRWFAFRGMVPLPGILYFIFALVSSFAALTPYLLDRLFAGRIKGIANSLVFPATWVASSGVRGDGVGAVADLHAHRKVVRRTGCEPKHAAHHQSTRSAAQITNECICRKASVWLAA